MNRKRALPVAAEKVEMPCAPLKLPPLPVYDNHKACQKCPGYCCKRFWMNCTKKTAKKRVNDPMAPEETQICAKFLVKHFIRLRKRDLKGTHWLGGKAYTCRLFDDKLGRCTGYDIRPPTCRYFLCEAAKNNQDPTKAPDFKDVHAWGRKVMARRKKEK